MDYQRHLNSICKQRMLEIFKYFIEFCEKHSLRWYCCGGTALGAVRHQGYIPWDDDIDVMMPRQDYDRFIQLWEAVGEMEYELIYPQLTNSFYLPFCKIMDRESSLLERRKTPCVLGLFLDVFPIDGYPANTSDAGKMIENFGVYRQSLSEVSSHEKLLDLLLLIVKGKVRRACRSARYAIHRDKNRRIILEELERTPYNYTYNECDELVVREFPDIQRPFKKEWLEPYRICKFETIDVRIPNDFDKYLSSLYGNYMELPPEEERINNHMESLFFFDLNKRLSYEEIMQEVSWKDRLFGKGH